MPSFYIIAGASIFAHLVLGCFLWYTCAKYSYKRDMQRLSNGDKTFLQSEPKKVYECVGQTEDNEQLYGYRVHCQIGSVLISNN